MKIGYPCINRTINCSSSRTFRLKSYSEKRLISTIKENLTCLEKVINWNINNSIYHFRITSDLIPFASHPICTFNWQEYFSPQLKKIGDIIKKNKMRVSMHPDQFTLINSIDEDIFSRSVKELEYHAEMLDIMGLNNSAKIQIHGGGVYGDKEKSIIRFVKRYKVLSHKIKNRLVVENDERSYSFHDCYWIFSETGIPVVFDYFHHSILNNNEKLNDILILQKKTWKKRDGIPIVDYSSQEPNQRKGKHAETINLKDFREFLTNSKGFDFDIMLEIKDKEKSALKAIRLITK